MSVQYNVQKVMERENRLIGRTEILLKIIHENGGTPSYKEIRKIFSDTHKVSDKLFVIRNITTKYGSWISLVSIHLYKDSKRLMEIEPEHVLRKNGFISEVKTDEST